MPVRKGDRHSFSCDSHEEGARSCWGNRLAGRDGRKAGHRPTVGEGWRTQHVGKSGGKKGGQSKGDALGRRKRTSRERKPRSGLHEAGGPDSERAQSVAATEKNTLLRSARQRRGVDKIRKTESLEKNLRLRWRLGGGLQGGNRGPKGGARTLEGRRGGAGK